MARSRSYSDSTYSLMEKLKEDTLSHGRLSSSSLLSKRNNTNQSLLKKQRRKSAADLDCIDEDDNIWKEYLYGSCTSVTSDPSTGQILEEEEESDCVFDDTDDDLRSDSAGSADIHDASEEKEQDNNSPSSPHVVTAEQPCITPLPTQVIPVEAAYQPSTTLVSTPDSKDVGVYVPGINPQRPCIDDVLEEDREYVIGIDIYKKREASNASSLSLSAMLNC